MMTNRRLVWGSLTLFLILSVLAAWQSNWKLLGIAWLAFMSMALALPLGTRAARQTNINHLIAGYGLASGAMITSAAIFLIPQAMQHHMAYGGAGIAAGIISGFAIHTLNHALSHHSKALDSIVLELTTHALTAGLIIGTIYTAMPGLSLILGIAIISHKGPAGYAAARRLAHNNRDPYQLLLPACAIGLTALPISFIDIPAHNLLNALIFGFATGVFFHVAIDFLPECEVGGEIHQHTDLEGHEHHVLDQYRKWAVVNTFAGGAVVFVLWFINH